MSTSAFGIDDIQVKKDAVLTINDCINIALNNNPVIKNARYNYGISKANVNIARSEFFPTLGVGTGFNHAANNTNRSDTTTNL